MLPEEFGGSHVAVEEVAALSMLELTRDRAEL